jgi:ATP-dependent helicase/nuclease subunit A
VTTRWTTGQQQAIEARDRNVLVSAGAGAGKTATLVERVTRLLTDPDNPVSIDQVLMVTFTRAAASEMRHRIALRLAAEIESLRAAGASRERLRHLQQQINILPRARISTLDSLCLNLLREHSDQVGLPPDFDLMGEDESRLVYREEIEARIEELLGDEAWAPTLRSMFTQLSATVGSAAMSDLVRGVLSFLEALARPRAFVAGVREHYAEAARAGVFEGFLAREIERLVREVLEAARAALDEFAQAAGDGADLSQKGAIEYHASATGLRREVHDLLGRLAPETTIREFPSLLKLPRRPSFRTKGSAGDFAVKGASATLKERLDAVAKKAKDWPEEFTLRSLLDTAASSAPFVELLLGPLGLELSERIFRRHADDQRLSFAHLERLAFELLLGPEGDGPTEIASRLRREFEHVVVDEFQDVNELQAMLLRALSRSPAEDGLPGNLFAVGDVKQSIYGFRQADPGQFLRMLADYAPCDNGVPAQEPGAAITLPDNFRTTPPLLEELNAFFEPLFSPRIGGIWYDDTHRLVARKPVPEVTGTRFEVHLLDAAGRGADDAADETGGSDAPDDDDATSSEAEARLVARIIRRLVDEEGFRGDEIAILLRTASKNAPIIVDALQRAGIQYQTQESIGFLAQQEVRDMLALLRVIDNPYREVALLGWLRGPVGNFSGDDLGELRLVNRRGRLFDNLRALASGEGDDPSLCERARLLTERLDGWRLASRRLPMGDLIARLEDEVHWRARLATQPNADQRLLNFQFLRDRAVQFDSFKRKGLGHFLAFLDDVLARDEKLGDPPALSATDASVRLMTIHKSKGLQFPVVIAPFLATRFNLRDLHENAIWDARTSFAVRFLPGRRYGQKVFSPAHAVLKESAHDKALSEELRLLYVALTRVEQRLVVTASGNKWGEWLEEARAVATREARAHVEDVATAHTRVGWLKAALSGRAELPGSLEEARGAVAPGRNGLVIKHHPRGEGTDEDALAVEDEPAPPGELMQELRESLERCARRAARQHGARPRAKLSVTEAKRAFEAIHSPDAPPARRPAALRRTEDPEWIPSALAGELPRTGARRGTVTHRFLALMDLDNLWGGGGLQAERDRLVAAGLLDASEAGAIDLDQIAMFLEDELGRRVLANRATVSREVPFFIGVPARDLSPELEEHADPVIVQGVVDLVWRERRADGETLHILDFKTDWWEGTLEHFDRLVAGYSPQLGLYRVGLERALGRPVSQSWLYFLSAGQAHETKPLGLAEWMAALARAALEGTG